MHQGVRNKGFTRIVEHSGSLAIKMVKADTFGTLPNIHCNAFPESQCVVYPSAVQLIVALPLDSTPALLW